MHRGEEEAFLGEIFNLGHRMAGAFWQRFLHTNYHCRHTHMCIYIRYAHVSGFHQFFHLHTNTSSRPSLGVLDDVQSSRGESTSHIQKSPGEQPASLQSVCFIRAQTYQYQYKQSFKRKRKQSQKNTNAKNRKLSLPSIPKSLNRSKTPSLQVKTITIVTPKVVQCVIT